MSDSKQKELSRENEQAVSPSPFGEEPDPGKQHRPTDEIYTGQDLRASTSGKAEKKENIGKDISILVMITLVAGFLLGVAYSVTKSPIADAKAQAKAEAQSTVMSMAQSFETLYFADSEEEEKKIPVSVEDALAKAGIETTKVTQIDAALDENGKRIGYVVTTSDPDGYGGNVVLMCGISNAEDGTLTIEGISFLELTETAGMGMRAKDEAFLNQFSRKTVEEGEEIAYVKGGADDANEIDAISGCTITTSAVTDNVNAALIAAGLVRDAQGQDGEALAASETEPSAANAEQEA